MKKVGIIMGSDSDLPVAQKAVDMLKSLGVPYEVHVYSAHRTPVEARDFSLNARKNGFGAIIAMAGMAAHLAGAIAANTTIPVIGIPCKSGALAGIDALLATVQIAGRTPKRSLEKTRPFSCSLSRSLLTKQSIIYGPQRPNTIKEKNNGKQARLHRKDQERL